MKFLLFIRMAGVLAAMLVIFNSQNAHSQRVIRKGTAPIHTNTRGTKQPTYQLNQFLGKWQEVSRTTKIKQSVTFTDTIFLHFTDSNKVETRNGTKSILKGEATIEEPGHQLVVAADIYTIVSVSTSEIILDDQDQYIHVLRNKDHFWHETLGKIPIAHEHFDVPVSFTMHQLIANWHIYRRQAKPGTVPANVELIKQLSIKQITSGETAEGEITCYKGNTTETIPCIFSLVNNKLIVRSEEYNWEWNVYKVNKKELVFGDASTLLYFAKPL